jgi:hypothetical protein
VADWVSRVLREPTASRAASALTDLLRLHYRYRFDPLGLSPEDREALRRHATRAIAAL